MKTRIIHFLSFLLLLTLTGFVSDAQNYTEGSVSIALDTSTGNYIISYPSGKGKMLHVVWELSNKIVPKVTPLVTFSYETQRFVYSYTVANENSAKQPIMNVRIQAGPIPKKSPPLSENLTPLKNAVPTLEHVEPEGWGFLNRVTPVHPFYLWIGGTGKFAFDKHKLIYPGNSLSGFSLTSLGLPGIVSARFVGHPVGPTLVFPEEPPQEIEAVFKKIDSNPKNRYVEVKTVGGVILPDKLTSEQLIDRLIELTQKAFKLGWIDDRETANQLTQRLKAAQDSLASKDLEGAMNVVNSFIHDVQAQHRYADRPTPQHKDKHLDENAFNLLEPNAEFIYYKLRTAISKNNRASLSTRGKAPVRRGFTGSLIMQRASKTASLLAELRASKLYCATAQYIPERSEPKQGVFRSLRNKTQ